jgi:hypothetical protein
MYLRFLSFSRLLWTPLPHVSLATPCVTIWTLLYLSYLVYFLLPSFYYIYSHVPLFRLKQFTSPLYPQPCNRACNRDCETATATLRSPSPQPSFTTANYTALLRLSLRPLRTLHLFISSLLNPATPPFLVDCDRDASKRPRPRPLICRNRLIHRDRYATFTVALSYCVPSRPVTLLYSFFTHSRLGQAWDSETLAHNCTLSHSSPSHMIASFEVWC